LPLAKVLCQWHKAAIHDCVNGRIICATGKEVMGKFLPLTKRDNATGTCHWHKLQLPLAISSKILKICANGTRKIGNCAIGRKICQWQIEVCLWQNKLPLAISNLPLTIFSNNGRNNWFTSNFPVFITEFVQTIWDG
tara:strand:+ start:399 stop:809 length:411 start_codon:yes stop_codon:yes gene_type:complete